MRRITRRQFVALAGLAGSVVLLNPLRARPLPARAAPSRQQIELLYMTHDYAPATPVNEQLIAEFQQAHPNVTITYDHAPHANYEEKVLTAFAGGRGPDVWWAGDWLVPQYVDNGLLAPVDVSAYGVTSVEAFRDLFEPGALEAFTVNGNVYTGGISEYNTFSLFYHPAHFQEAGLPVPPEDKPLTWEQVAEYAEKLTKFDQSGTRTRSGLEWVYNVPIWTVLLYEPMLRQLGGEVFDASTGKPNFLSDQMIKTMRFVQDLRTRRKANDPSFLTNLVEDFANERISMVIMGPWAFSLIRNTNPNARVAVAPLPVFEGGTRITTLYAWAWFVSAKSPVERQRVGWEFTNFLSSKGQLWWDKVRYIQPRKGKADTGADLAAYRLEQEPLLKVFLDDFKYGKYQFRSKHYYEIASAWMRGVSRIQEGENVEQVLRDTQDAVGELSG